MFTNNGRLTQASSAVRRRLARLEGGETHNGGLGESSKHLTSVIKRIDKFKLIINTAGLTSGLLRWRNVRQKRKY